jgi:hypothetical protein
LQRVLFLHGISHDSQKIILTGTADVWTSSNDNGGEKDGMKIINTVLQDKVREVT